MSNYDIYRKCSIVQRAFKVFWAHTGVTIDDMQTMYNSAFVPQNQIAPNAPWESLRFQASGGGLS